MQNTETRLPTSARLMTVREAAQRLGIGQHTMRRLADDGRLPTVRVSERGWRLFKPAAVEEFAVQIGADR